MKEALLTVLRSKDTPPSSFRKAARMLSDLVAAEIAMEARESFHEVETTFGSARGTKLQKPPILVPILRAGMALLPSFLHFFDTAKVGLLGIRRNEKAIPEVYYTHLPQIASKDSILILDPMIATAGSTMTAIEMILKAGGAAENIQIVALIAAPEGIEVIQKKYPNIPLHITKVDEGLNEKKYIIPGLGDFGDRYFGTIES